MAPRLHTERSEKKRTAFHLLNAGICFTLLAMGKNFSVIGLGLFVCLAASGAVSAAELAPHVPGELIVRIRDGAQISANSAYAGALRELGAQDVGALALAPRFRKVAVPQGVKLEKAIERLARTEGVSYAEPNYLYSISSLDPVGAQESYVPSDKQFTEQWALDNTGQKISERGRPSYFGLKGFDVGIRRLWDEKPETLAAASDIKVAVIDTGVAWNHGELASNIWTNSGEMGPLTAEQAAKAPIGCKDKSCNGVDDDGNGLVDDWRGWNWGMLPKGNQPVVGNNNPFDDNGHGTHVAGVIGARHNKSEIAGINDRVQIMAIKFLTKDGAGTLEGAALSVLYAGLMGADVINASWGGSGESQVLAEVVKQVTDAGVLFVAAAGNSGMDNDMFENWPANYPFPGVVSVAASDPRGMLAYFSCYGKRKVHITAPGHVILSTMPNSRTQFLSGTSMAAPQVAGVAALVLGTNPELRRQPAQLRKRLTETSVIHATLIGRTSSGGQVNAYNAVKGIVPSGHQRPDRTDWGATVEHALASPHPYANGAADSYVIHAPGAKWVRLRIGRYAMEKSKDHLEIYDAQGGLVDAITGFGVGAVTAPVQGDTVKLVFRSDDSVNGWGFEILGYETLQ